jgi:hypothetical protein
MVGAACAEARVIKTTASSRPPQAAKRKLRAMKTSSILFAMVAVSLIYGEIMWSNL